MRLWNGRVLRRHRPFMWLWGQMQHEKLLGVRHWGFWFTEPAEW